MGATSIEWTEQTWNPVVGCEKISPGCAHCYAETMAARIKAMAIADIAAGRNPGRKRHYIDAIDDKGRWSGELIPVPESLSDPLSWRKPRRVFVNSMSDLFHADVSREFIAHAFGVMAYARQHTFQILTKRAQRMNDIVQSLTLSECLNAAGLAPDFDPSWPLVNVWLGVSVERQKEANERHDRLPHAAVRFWSAEQLLESIDCREAWRNSALPDWVIVGGESGHGARPCRETWIRDIVRQCKDAGVPCFVKQLGSNAESGYGVNRKLQLNDPKGGDPDEWPEDLRVREFPQMEELGK